MAGTERAELLPLPLLSFRWRRINLRSPSKWPSWKSHRYRRRAQISMKAYLAQHYLHVPGGFVGQLAYCEAFIKYTAVGLFFPGQIKRSKVALRTRQVNSAPRRTSPQTPRAVLHPNGAALFFAFFFTREPGCVGSGPRWNL